MALCKLRGIALLIDLSDEITEMMTTVEKYSTEIDTMIEITDVIRVLEKWYNRIVIINGTYIRIDTEVLKEIRTLTAKYRRRKTEGWETVPARYVIKDLEQLELKLSEYLTDLEKQLDKLCSN